MYRRRRPVREIPFSFDSFLDVVTNVVGIIIRLILVVWVAARSYTGIVEQQPAPTATAAKETAALPEDPLKSEVAQRRKELEELQARLLAQLRQAAETQQDQAQTRQTVATLTARRTQLSTEVAALDGNTQTEGAAAQQLAVSSAELRERSRRLAQEIAALEKVPVVKQTLRYRTPVSAPVHSEELMFECRHGHVTFIDMSLLVQEVRADMDEKKQVLQRQWQAEGTTVPVGAFRFHYVMERERGRLDALTPLGSPDADTSFRYSLSRGDLVPIAEPRGEEVERALRPGSEFRQLVDLIDPKMTTVTFWVYPDSFPLFRRLRDYLYQRDVTVAGRPLPEDVPIGYSRQGSVSRGQ
jgi:hypothetical protein